MVPYKFYNLIFYTMVMMICVLIYQTLCNNKYISICSITCLAEYIYFLI